MASDNENVMCPLVGYEIEPIDCILNCDCVSGMLKIENMPDIFKKSPDFADICKKCKNHNR